MARRGMLAAAATAVAVAVATGGTVAATQMGWLARADSCLGSPVTLRGTDGADRLEGTPGRDVIHAGRGDDRVEGLGGDDLLCGGAGADVLHGGEGADRLHGGDDGRVVADTEYYEWYGDTLDGGPGDDVLDTGFDDDGVGRTYVRPESVSFATAARGVRVDLVAGTATGDGEDRIEGVPTGIVGSRHDDVLLGSDRPETIIGARGADRIGGRGGADRLHAGTRMHPDRDVEANRLAGGPGADELMGGSGDDVLLGGTGRDHLQSGLGADLVRGGPGPDGVADTAVPGAGPLLSGGAGPDRLSVHLVDRHGDFVERARGRFDLGAGLLDAVRDGDRWSIPLSGFEDVTTTARLPLWGSDAAETLWGAHDRVRAELHGRGGDDVLQGTFRDDLLDGGRGRDTAWPWVGDDTLVSIERVRR